MTCQKCGLPETLCICNTEELKSKIKFSEEACYRCGRMGEYIETKKFGKTWIVNIIGGLCDGCRQAEGIKAKQHLKEMYG